MPRIKLKVYMGSGNIRRRIHYIKSCNWYEGYARYMDTDVSVPGYLRAETYTEAKRELETQITQILNGSRERLA
jgi:hypothetical protein